MNNKKHEQVTRDSFFKRVVMSMPKSISVPDNTNHLIPSYLVIKKETVSKVSAKVINQSINHREQ